VYIGESSAKVSPPDEDEVDLLSESEHYREGMSRLSCQIVLLPMLAGLHVELAPQE
jgi:2Fe-2S ferredoxin